MSLFLGCVLQVLIAANSASKEKAQVWFDSLLFYYTFVIEVDLFSWSLGFLASLSDSNVRVKIEENVKANRNAIYSVSFQVSLSLS